MKLYVVTAGCRYYPTPEDGDWISVHADEEEALMAGARARGDWAAVILIDTSIPNYWDVIWSR